MEERISTSHERGVWLSSCHRECEGSRISSGKSKCESWLNDSISCRNDGKIDP